MKLNISGGSLTIIGTGIYGINQTTLEARTCLERADKVLFLVNDLATSHWIKKLNRTAESLSSFYEEDKNRLKTYLEMVERILSCVREGKNVCVAFYGHPGVFVYPSHEALRRARLEGFRAKMLPGISAEDCLFADLGLDPGTSGCQSFETTDFLIYNRKFDPYVSLILWQIATIGEVEYRTDQMYNSRGLHVLTEVLLESYSLDHETIIYEAAQYPMQDPIIKHVPLAKVPEISITPISTLYIPPKAPSLPNRDMLDRLGIP